MQIILASGSPRRRELIEQLGFDFEVIAADIDETAREGEHPLDLVQRLAKEKAHAVAEGLGDEKNEAIIIAADTLVYNQQLKIFGKSHTADKAAEMLSELSGKAHSVSTGVCILGPVHMIAGSAMRPERVFEDTSTVHFRNLTKEEIEAYVSSGEPLDKAGAYAIQGKGRFLIHSIVGSYDSIVGLPLERLARELAALDDPQLICKLLS